MQSFAKILRKNMTDTERYLWRFLKNRQLGNFKFRRQVVIGKFIVDFVCFEKKVIIELDGSQHFQSKKKDSIRDKWLIAEGYRILRFWDNSVFKNLEAVLEEIYRACCHPPPDPHPSREGDDIY